MVTWYIHRHFRAACNEMNGQCKKVCRRWMCACACLRACVYVNRIIRRSLISEWLQDRNSSSDSLSLPYCMSPDGLQFPEWSLYWMRLILDETFCVYEYYKQKASLISIVQSHPLERGIFCCESAMLCVYNHVP